MFDGWRSLPTLNLVQTLIEIQNMENQEIINEEKGNDVNHVL